MKSRRSLLIFLILLAVALLSAQAQNAAIDPAVLAKANAGDMAAQVLVGKSYAAGNGQARDFRQIAEDYSQAAAWFRKAAEQGSATGQLQLAALYRDGKGFPRDMTEAAKWYRKAAEQGDVTAQATLGLLYSIGQGLPQSDVEAYYWLDLAASVKGPKQEQYAANRQMIGTHITTDELAEVEERVAKWRAAHPRLAASE